jgi:hypothetical protein
MRPPRRRPIDEATFRGALDARGILREDALALPGLADAFTVFAQRTDSRVEVGEWRGHAERFFATRIGLTVDKRYDSQAETPSIDAARVVVAPVSGEGGTRTAWGRPREDDDIHAAEDAEARSGTRGLALLARRCAHVWLVEIEREDDRVALRLAAILAGVLLGPILAPGASLIFGPKTAREKLAAT